MATLVLQLGCATTGIQRSEKAHDSVKDLDRKYGKLMKQIDDTVYALGVITRDLDTGAPAEG